MLELDRNIVAEQVGPGDARGVAARIVEPGKCPHRAMGRARRSRMIVDPEFRISEAAGGAILGIGQLAAVEIGFERLAQIGDRLVEYRAELFDDRLDGLGL